jgi:hypothetical protein
VSVDFSEELDRAQGPFTGYGFLPEPPCPVDNSRRNSGQLRDFQAPNHYVCLKGGSGEGAMVPLGACLVPAALDTWAVKSHVGSLDVEPIDQNGAKSERSREIFRLGQKCLLALPSSLLFAHRRAVSIVRGGMESAGKTAHPKPRQDARRIHDRTER